MPRCSQPTKCHFTCRACTLPDCVPAAQAHTTGALAFAEAFECATLPGSMLGCVAMLGPTNPRASKPFACSWTAATARACHMPRT